MRDEKTMRLYRCAMREAEALRKACEARKLSKACDARKAKRSA